MKLPIFVLLSALVSIAGAWTIGNYGIINNFIWPEDSKDLPGFSSKQIVNFWNFYFENFTLAIGDQLTNVKELEFFEGTVLQVHLKHNIEKLVIFQSKTKNVEIYPDEDYAIVDLTVRSCELTRIPKNINRLRRLRELSLPWNKIEHVVMSDFNGLNNLENLMLYGNGMKTLSSESTIHLPKLSLLDLASNNLREINVCSWDMPALEEFYLHKNKLKFVVNLVDQFPKLSQISIYDNPLVCQWKDSLVRSLESKNILQVFGEATCNATDETHVPKECPMVYSLSNQLSGLLEKQRSFENSTKKIESLEQMVKKSNEENQLLKENQSQWSKEIVSLQQMLKKSNEESQLLKETVATLTDQLTKLRHSIDDLTEGFYRYVLEKEGSEK